jgi:plastocyanin
MQFVITVLFVVLLAPACGGGEQTADASLPRDGAPIDLAVEAPPETSPEADSSTVGDADVDGTPDAPQEPFTAIDPCPTPSAYTVGGSGRIATGDNVYLPACLRVSAGSNVAIEASTFHPLEPAVGGSPGNPIPSDIIDVTVAFPNPGFYPFYCPEHVGQGMRGVVWVTGL